MPVGPRPYRSTLKFRFSPFRSNARLLVGGAPPVRSRPPSVRPGVDGRRWSPTLILVFLACLLLVPLATLLHYEALHLLSSGLPTLRVPSRARLVAAVLGTFTAHALQIVLYATVLWLLAHVGVAGTLGSAAAPAFTDVLYFSAETYTSLGYGDLVPNGPLRALAGVEALNGLLLIGWSASYLYVAMERFWDVGPAPR